MTIEIIHSHLGHRLAVDGTWAHRVELEQLAEVARPFAPGAAEALVDWDGAETARLRAYAVIRNAVRERMVARDGETTTEALDRRAFRLIA